MAGSPNPATGVNSLDQFKAQLGRLRNQLTDAALEEPPSPAAEIKWFTQPPELPKFKYDTYKRLAKQTRFLNDAEKNYLRQKFGTSINPDNFRIGYDLGISGTNVKGWTSPDLPTTIFLPADTEDTVSDTLAHEATHGWQLLRGGHDPTSWTPLYDVQGVSPKNEKEFKALSAEQQAELVRLGDPTAVKYVREHPASSSPRGEQAFIDSVRQRYYKDSLDPDIAARFGALGGVSDVYGQRVGKGLPIAPLEQRAQPEALEAPPTQRDEFMAVPDPQGLEVRGNLSIRNRPVIRNDDGTPSTEYSISNFDERDGLEVLVPTIVNGKFLTPDGKKPPEGSDAEKEMFKRAWQHYEDTGEHLGKFRTPEDATAYAHELHNTQDARARGQDARVQDTGISEQLVQNIKDLEGFRDTAYHNTEDPEGVWTIGYGRTTDVGEGDTTNKEFEDSALRATVHDIRSQIKNLVTVPLSPRQLDALTSLSYNIGLPAFQNSTLLAKINANDPTAPQEFDRWIHSAGQARPDLIKRRELEKSWFSDGQLPGATPSAAAQVNTLDQFKSQLAQLRQAETQGAKPPAGQVPLPRQIYTSGPTAPAMALPLDEQKKRFEDVVKKNWVPQWLADWVEPPKAPPPSGAGAPSRAQFLTPPPPGYIPPATNIGEFKTRLAEVKRAEGDTTPVISRAPTWRDTTRTQTSGWETQPFGEHMSKWVGEKFRGYAEAANPTEQQIQQRVQNMNPFVLGFLFHTLEGRPMLVDTPEARNRVTNYLQLYRSLEIGAFQRVGEFIGDPVNVAFMISAGPLGEALPLPLAVGIDSYFALQMAMGAGADITNAVRIGRELNWNVRPQTGADGKLEWLPGQGEFWQYALGAPVDAYFARMGIKHLPQRIAMMRVFGEFDDAAQQKYGKDWNSLSPEEKTKAYFDVQKKNAGKTQFYPGTYHEWADRLNAMPAWYRDWAIKKGYLDPDRKAEWHYLAWAEAFGLRKEPRNYEEAEKQFADATKAVREAERKRLELDKDLRAIDQRMRTPKEHPPNELEPPPIIGGAGYLPKVESIWTPGRERLVTVYEPDVSHGIGDIARMSPDEREWVRQKWREQQAMRVLENERLRDIVEQHEREQAAADASKRAADEAVERRERISEQALKIADRRGIRMYVGEAEQFAEDLEKLKQRANAVAESQMWESPEKFEEHLRGPRDRAYTPLEDDFLHLMDEIRTLAPYADVLNLPIEYGREVGEPEPVGPPRTDVMRERLKSVETEEQARRVLDGADDDQLFELMHPANRAIDPAGGRSIYTHAGERPLFKDRRGNRREGSPWEPLEGVVVVEPEERVHPDDVPPWATPGPLPVPESQAIPADKPIPDDLYQAGIREAALEGGRIDAADLQRELGISEGDAARLLTRLRAEGHVVPEPTKLEAPPTEPELPPEEQLYRDAVRYVVQFGKASTSLLQRRLHLGYGKTTELIERMEREGIVRPGEGPKPREIANVPEWATAPTPTLEPPPAPKPPSKLGSFILQVVQEGRGDYGSPNYVEPVIVVGRVDETAPRENWNWTDWAAGEYNRRFNALLEDIDLADRKSKLIDAADDLNRQAGEARGKEAEDLVKAAEEAQRRVDEIDAKRREQAKKDLEATKTTQENWPVGQWIDEVARGNDTFILLPSGRRIKAHYALVLTDNLIASHKPLQNFVPNPDYIWFNEEMTVSPVQPWDYFHNEARQNLTKYRAANPELLSIYNTTPTGTDGPAVVRADGIKLGGNNRDFIHELMYQAGRGQEIVDMINATKAQFGIIDETPDVSRKPEIVRVADEPIESRKDLIDVGDELNRPSGTQANVAEESAALARRFTPEFKEWIVAAFDAMDDDATLRSFMTRYTEELAKRMENENWFSPGQKGEWVQETPDGQKELTKAAKEHFENAVRGLVIKDPRALQLLQTDGMRSMGQTIDRALPGLLRMVAKNGIWDVSDYLSKAIRTYGEIIDAQKSIDDAVGIAHDEMKKAKMSQEAIDAVTRVDGLLYPDKLRGYTPPFLGEVGEGVPKPPTVDKITESLMRLIELKSAEIKKAVQGYSTDAEGKQVSMFAPPSPWQSFTNNISGRFGIELTESDWGRLEREAEDKPLQGDLPPRTADVPQPAGPGPNETAMREQLMQHGGIAPAQREAMIDIWRRWAERYLKEPFESFLGRVLARIETGGEYERKPGETVLKQEEPVSRLDRIRERMRERRKLINKKYRDHLTTEQLDDLTKTTKVAKQLAEVVRKLPAIKEWEEAAKAGAVARKWYEKASEAFASLSEVAPQLFPVEDRQRWVDFVAAISPQQAVKFNLQMALEHWGKWIEAGRPLKRGELNRLFKTLDLPARRKNAVRAIMGENLSGYKVTAFGKSLYGIHGWIPNDTWMKLFSGLSRVDRPKFNHAINVRVRQVAERLGWHDEEVQAAIWAFTKALGETIGKDTNYDPVEAVSKLTNKEIAERMADMSALMRDSDIQSTLQALGVDTDALNRRLQATERRRAQVSPEKPFGIEAADPDVLRSIARRIGATGFPEEAEELEPPPTELFQAERQGRETIYRGEAVLLNDGRAIMRLFNSATFSTLAEESIHIMRRHIKPEDTAVLERNLAEAGLPVKDGIWLTDHEEKVADWWKRYLRDGKAPSDDPKLIALFRKLKAWMVAIYRDLKKHPELGEVPKEVAQVFDRMLEGEPDLEEEAAPEEPLETPPGETVPSVPRDSEVVYRGTGPDPTTLGRPLNVQQFDSPENALDWIIKNADTLEGVLVHKAADGKAYVQYTEHPAPPPGMEAPPVMIHTPEEPGLFGPMPTPEAAIEPPPPTTTTLPDVESRLLAATQKANKAASVEAWREQEAISNEAAKAYEQAINAGQSRAELRRQYPNAEQAYKDYLIDLEEAEERGGLAPPPEQARLMEKQDLRDLLPEGVRVYASGAERIPDIRGFTEAGVPVGLSMQRVGPAQIKALGNLAGKGIPVFLDSGAYSEGRDPEMISGAIDWDRVLTGYEELSKKLGRQLTVVAPDRVGDQNETLARLANNADRIRQIAGNGARIVMPIQVGELSLTDFYHAARSLAGTRIVPGFPMAKAVADPQAIVDFVRQIRPDEIHLLGLGGSNAKTDVLVRALKDANPELQISMDAVATRAKVGEGRPVTEKQRAYRLSMMEGVRGEVDLRRWGGPALDYTENIFNPSEWASPKELKQIAADAQLSEEDQAAFIEDPEGWLGSHDTDDLMMWTLDDAYHKFVDKEVRGPARTAAIAETFEEGKIGRQIEPPPEETLELATPPERSPAEMTFNEFKTQPNVLSVPKGSILAFEPEELTPENLSKYPLTQVQMLANLLGVNKSGSKKAISERIVKRVQFRQRLKKETVESLNKNYKSTELRQMVKEAGTYAGGSKDSMARVLMKWLDDGTQKIRRDIVNAKHQNHVVKAAKNGLPVNPENLSRYKLNPDGTPAPTLDAAAATRDVLSHELEEASKLEAPPPEEAAKEPEREGVEARIKTRELQFIAAYVSNYRRYFRGESEPQESHIRDLAKIVWKDGILAGEANIQAPVIRKTLKDLGIDVSTPKKAKEAIADWIAGKEPKPALEAPPEQDLQRTLDEIVGAIPPEAAAPEVTKGGRRMVEVDPKRIEWGKGGDIEKSYSGDTIANKGKIRSVVMIEGKRYVNTGGGGGGGLPVTVDLARLYTPKEWGDRPIYDRTHVNHVTGYEGIKVTHRKDTYILGGREDEIRAIPKGTPPEIKQRLFQADNPTARDLKISVIRARLDMNPTPEMRAKLEYLLAELTGETPPLQPPPAPKVEVPAEKKPVEKPKEVKSAGEPPVEKKAAQPKTVRIWTPRGEVEVQLPAKGEGRGEGAPRTDKGGKATDGVDRDKDTPKAHGVPVEPRQQPGRGEDRPAGRRVPVSGGERPERGGRGTARTPLQDVPPTRIEAPKRGRGTPLYDDAEWKERAKLYGLPDGMPVPFVRLDDDLRLLFPYAGQKELIESILSGLAQHDSFILASTTGTGKTFMANGVLQQLMRRQKMDRVLMLTTSQNLVKDFKKTALNFDNDVKALPEGVSVPDEPGIYATTYATALNRSGIEDYPWDLIIADEIAAARRALMGSKQGSMMKTMAGNAKQILYMSATPFHTALEIGHMDRLGLWDKEGYDSWAKQFGVYKDKNGKYGGGNAPKLLTKLRGQMIERGQYANIDRNMEGYHPSFLLAPLSEEDKVGLKAIREGFDLAKHYYATHGKRNKVRALQGIMVVYMKSYLERRRLPAAIELAKKGEKSGYKAIFFSEHRSGRDELFDILEEPNEYYRGEIERTMPKLPDVVETLQNAFPNDLANFSGAASEIREDEKDSFLKNLKKHIFATYGAGGVGVSLHDEIGNRPRMAIYLGLPYSGVMLDQAIGRPWRYGTKSDVLAYFLLSDSRAEVDLVLKKVAPRMESLRAVVSGVDMTDPLTVSMRELESSQEAALGYDLGEQHKVDASDLETVATRVPIMNYKNAPMPPAEELMNKGMKYPGPVAKHPGVGRMMQREEYEPSKEELGMEELPLPEESEARLRNEEMADDFATGRGTPGMTPEELNSIPAPQRVPLAQAAEEDADAHILEFDEEDRNANATVRRVHENNAKWIKTVMANVRQSRAAETLRESTAAGATRALDTTFFTSGQTLIYNLAKKHGAEVIGKELVKDIGRYHRDAGNVAGPLIQRYLDIIKKHKLSKEEHHNMWLVKEGVTRRIDEDDPNSPKVSVQPLNERVTAAVEDVRKFLQDVKDILAKEGIATKARDPVTGELRWRLFADQLDDPKYMPHRYDYDQKIVVVNEDTGKKETITLRELLKGKKLGEARYQRIVRQLSKRTGLTTEEVEDWLKDREDRDVPLVGNIERPRDVDMPYYRTDQAAMVEYLFGMGEVVARERIFGQDRHKLDLKVRKVPDADARERINEIFDLLLKRRYWDEDTHKLVQLAASWSVLTHMTLSAVKVPFHALHLSLYTDARTLGRAILQFSLHPNDTRRWAQYIGATLEQMRANLRAELGLRRGAANWMLDHNAFHNLYTMDRALTAAAARIYLDNRALPKLLKGKNVDYMRRQLRDVFLLDDGAINKAIENKRWTEADYAGAGKRLSDLVMMTADPTELPPGWRARAKEPYADTALAAVRMTTLLRSFMFKTSRILKDRLVMEVVHHNNWRPLIPFLVLYPLAGEVMRQLAGITSAKQDPEYKWWLDPKHHTLYEYAKRAMEDIAWPIAYTELFFFNTAFSGDSLMLRGLEWVVGPDLTDAFRPFKFGFDYAKAKTDYGRRQALKAWATGQFSIMGPVYRVEEWLTGYDPKKEKKKAAKQAAAKRRAEQRFKPHLPTRRSGVPGLEAPPLR